MTNVDKISDFMLERYLVGDLPAEEMAALQKREAEDEVFAARVKSMREDGARILAENPFGALERKLEEAEWAASAREDDFARTTNTLWLRVAAALVLAVGIFSAVLLNRSVSTYDAGETSMEVAMAQVDAGVTRIKGLDARMEVWKKTGDSAVQMSNLDEAREGDEIQLRYAVPEKCFGMLFSMDGNGTVTMHMADGSGAIPLEPGKMTTLPFAYRLDNAPRFEKFFLLTSRELFSIDLEKIDALLNRKDIHTVVLTLRKVEM